MGKKTKRPSQRIRRASEANEAVERILAQTNALGASLGSDVGLGPHGQKLARANVARQRQGLSMQWPSVMIERLGRDSMHDLASDVARYAVVDLWRKQGRVTYDLHPEMASSLYRSDLKGKLPGSLFSRLPHINPMIALPHAWPFRNQDGMEGQIRGYFLSGTTGYGLCTTTDKRSEGLVLVPWIDFYNKQTGELEYPITPILALPNTTGSFTLDDMVGSSTEWQSGKAQIRKGDKKLIKQLVPGALTILSYLCCKNADIEKPPPQPTGKRHQAPPQDPFYIRVGWYIGPRLHAARARAAGRSRDGASTPSGVEYGPQHRVGHPKTVWVGPGRKKDESIWVDPYWTKLDMLDEGQEPVTQVVPVDPQRGDPSSHKGIRRANLGTAKANEITKRERQRAREEGWDF